MLLFGSVILWAIASNANAAPDTISPLRISWADRINGSVVSLPINDGIKKFFLGFDKPNLGFQECSTSSGLSGRCRFLRYCAQPDILQSYTTFLLSSCFIDSGYVGVCCSSGITAPHLDENYLKEFKTSTLTVAVSANQMASAKRTTKSPQVPAVRPSASLTVTKRPSISQISTNATRKAVAVPVTASSAITRLTTKMPSVVSRSPLIGAQRVTTKSPNLLGSASISRQPVITQQAVTKQPSALVQSPITRQPTVLAQKLVTKQPISAQPSATKLVTQQPISTMQKTITQTSTSQSSNSAAAPQNDRCGSLLKEDTRIVGGKAVDKNEWPWMAALLLTGTDPFCGAVLITEQHVLTAAHCIVKRKLSELRVRLGEYDLSTISRTELDLSVVRAHIHGAFNSMNLKNDIALLKLQRNVRITPKLQPICLPTSNAILDGQAGYVAGWGTTSFAGSSSKILLEVLLPIWKQSECATVLKDHNYTGTQLCAGYKQGGKDSCQGDSGGPLMYQISRGKWVVVGLVSWGKGCGSPNEPGIYTRVTSYLPWIRDKILED